MIYHATRDQYNAALRRHQPQIDQTIGIYFDFLRQSHFFAGPDQDLGAIRHEAVHQFFPGVRQNHPSRRLDRQRVGPGRRRLLL